MRARILGELHARPVRPLETPARILHFAFMTDGAQAEADRAALAKACLERGLPEARCPGAAIPAGDLQCAALLWERHGEFITHSWEFAGPQAKRPSPLRPPSLCKACKCCRSPARCWSPPTCTCWPATARSGAIWPKSSARCNWRSLRSKTGRALIATDFAPDTFGFVRIFIANRAMPPLTAGGLAQRALEIETYRTLALMGLPEAQRLAPSIRHIEEELPRILDAMKQSKGVDANRQLLDELTGAGRRAGSRRRRQPVPLRRHARL